MTYSTKVFLSLSFFFLIIYFGISIWTLQLISRQVLNQEQDHIHLEQKNNSIFLAASILDNKVTDDFMLRLGTQLKTQNQNPFFIIDKQGHTTYSINKKIIPPNFIKNTFRFKPKKNDILISKTQNEGKKKFVYALSQIGNTDYYLLNKQRLNNYEKMTKKVKLYFRFIMLSLVCLFVPISWFLTRLILQPVRELTNVAQNISNGKIQQRFQLSNKDDELHQLTTSLNQMADKLSDDIKQITKSKENQTLFASGLSHEIRTPLTSILGYAQMLQSEETDNEKKAFLAYIVKEGLRLKGLSEDVIKLIQFDKQQLELTEVSTQQLSEDIHKFLSGIPTDFTFQLSLSDAILMADYNLLKLMYINILSNALEALPQKGILSIKGEIKNGRYLISFEDNGNGITDKNLKKIKLAFFTEMASRSTNHLGLGLTFVQTISSLHGGELTITSKKNIGTIVTVDFPLGGKEHE